MIDTGYWIMTLGLWKGGSENHWPIVPSVTIVICYHIFRLLVSFINPTVKRHQSSKCHWEEKWDLAHVSRLTHDVESIKQSMQVLTQHTREVIKINCQILNQFLYCVGYGRKGKTFLFLNNLKLTPTFLFLNNKK